jgi:hypothetical protein
VTARWDACGKSIDIQSEDGDDPPFHVILESRQPGNDRDALVVSDGPGTEDEQVSRGGPLRGAEELTAVWAADGRTVELRSSSRPELDLDIGFLGREGQRQICP